MVVRNYDGRLAGSFGVAHGHILLRAQ
jgi:hypothetical protein